MLSKLASDQAVYLQSSTTVASPKSAGQSTMVDLPLQVLTTSVKLEPI
jgi:hypothetical protein